MNLWEKLSKNMSHLKITRVHRRWWVKRGGMLNPQFLCHRNIKIYQNVLWDITLTMRFIIKIPLKDFYNLIFIKNHILYPRRTFKVKNPKAPSEPQEQYHHHLDHHQRTLTVFVFSLHRYVKGYLMPSECSVPCLEQNDAMEQSTGSRINQFYLPLSILKYFIAI